jgi:2-iminobutanoate/2-iminopropanoate deaminase
MRKVEAVKKTLDNPSGAPAPAGPYSQVARLEMADGVLLFLSGQVALDSDNQVIAPGDMTVQSEHVLEAIRALLEAHGAAFSDIVNIRTFITDMNLLPEYAAVRRKFLTTQPPTSTTVEVSKLFKPGAVIEVEVVAAVNGTSGT